MLVEVSVGFSRSLPQRGFLDFASTFRFIHTLKPDLKLTLRLCVVENKKVSRNSDILEFIQELVRIPSRGGIDPYEPVVSRVGRWLEEHKIPTYRLVHPTQGSVGLYAIVQGRVLEPVYAINATLDTAGFGDESQWTVPVLGGEIRGNWLYGRGAGDSKAAVAIFCHVAAELARMRDRLHGSVIILFDADEHTGGFLGIKTYLHGSGIELPRGVFIGYPGNDRIITGSRGFARAVIAVHGRAAHSGSTKNRGVNAITCATQVVEQFNAVNLENESAADFPLPPQLTVTSIEGGESFSVVPDLCQLRVDVRLTPSFDETRAHRLVEDIVSQTESRGGFRITIDWLEGWPSYRLPEEQELVVALRSEAEFAFGKEIPTGISGPSNVGNYLATQHIPAVSGFGVTYRNLHATDECIETTSILPVYEVYLRTLKRLLQAH